VNRQLNSVTRLAATALLLGTVGLACARPNDATGGQPAGPTSTTQQSPADQPTATLAPAPQDTATDAAAPTVAATDSPAAVGTSGAAAADPLDSQFSNLDNLLNGVNGSLSGSDTSGGE
jgi:hypothetical protein